MRPGLNSMFSQPHSAAESVKPPHNIDDFGRDQRLPRFALRNSSPNLCGTDAAKICRHIQHLDPVRDAGRRHEISTPCRYQQPELLEHIVDSIGAAIIPSENALSGIAATDKP
jgi:hypothetical protein